MAWHAALRLEYERDGERTRARVEHSGPLRALKALYPQGPGICHHVLLHPPAGLVGGDSLALTLSLAPGSHAVLTTPGASRYYRSAGADATQSVQARLAAGARLEWLPLENLVYSGAQAVNRQVFELAPEAEMIGWDILALGLPAADAPFVAGRVHQRIEIAGLWLDQGVIAASDRLLLDSPLGLAGQPAIGTLWMVWGSAPGQQRAEQTLEATRTLLSDVEGGVAAGVTLVHPRVVVLRALGPRTEPLFQLFRAVRRLWRASLWQLPDCEPRVWRT